MYTKNILSAGIDIGTTTTQVIFSRMVLKDISGFGRIPRIEVVSKEVVYESPIHITPLSSRDEIDSEAVAAIIRGEYGRAGFTPDDPDTGAVIITGETSRKRNAKSVVSRMSDLAGNFVVAAAGPDLESVLAGKGAGAAWLSREAQSSVVNLDIGGGTTNIALFENGKTAETACLDIGGRLVKLSGDVISYVAPKIIWLSKEYGIELYEGKRASVYELETLADIMADLLAQSVGLAPRTAALDYMKTNHLLSGNITPEKITFSGGVAACFDYNGDPFCYDDIGVLLARAIKKHPAFRSAQISKASETMRATVIGAGNYSMQISGSTIEYTAEKFPITNIPVVKIQLEKREDIALIGENLHRAVGLLKSGSKEHTEEYENKSADGYADNYANEYTHTAIAFKGLKCPSFDDIRLIAEGLISRLEKEAAPGEEIIIIVEEDMGKALGQALRHYLKGKRPVICIDSISCDSGDFIDLGEPVVKGQVIPVVVKTLIFKDGCD